MFGFTCKTPARIFFSFLLAGVLICPFVFAQPPGQTLKSADAAMQDGRFADAARIYETWLQSHPNAKEVLLALGICYLQLGRQSEAVATLRRHIRLFPRSAAGHAALGIALLDGANTALAKTELKTAVQLNPKQADAVKALARIYLVEGNARQAVSLLRPLITAEADEETRILLGDALIKAGQADAAGAMLERQIKTNPRSSARLYATAAWAYLKAGNNAKVAEICEPGMRLYPDSEIEAVYLALPAPFLAERIGARIERMQQAPEVSELIALGRVLTDADKAGKTRANEIAQKLLAHAVALAPDNASAHYNYGRALSERNPTQAVLEWEKALTLQPAPELRLQILNKLAAVKLDSSDFEAAETAWKAALEINRQLPDRNPEAMLDYVRFLQLRARSAEAETLLGEILRWHPLSPQVHLELAKLRAARGQWDKVAEAGEFVLRNTEDDEELLRAAHLLLARAYTRLNQPEKAARHTKWMASQR